MNKYSKYHKLIIVKLKIKNKLIKSSLFLLIDSIKRKWNQVDESYSNKNKLLLALQNME